MKKRPGLAHLKNPVNGIYKSNQLTCIQVWSGPAVGVTATDADETTTMPPTTLTTWPVVSAAVTVADDSATTLTLSTSLRPRCSRRRRRWGRQSAVPDGCSGPSGYQGLGIGVTIVAKGDHGQDGNRGSGLARDLDTSCLILVCSEGGNPRSQTRLACPGSSAS